MGILTNRQECLNWLKSNKITTLGLSPIMINEIQRSIQ